jgi:hypothetical protein
MILLYLLQVQVRKLHGPRIYADGTDGGKITRRKANEKKYEKTQESLLYISGYYAESGDGMFLQQPCFFADRQC